MEVSFNEAETRYYSDLFTFCDVEKMGKIPMIKATELFRSANVTEEILKEIISLAGIPETALHISRAQFYACLKLIAAHQADIFVAPAQAAIQLQQELSSASIQLPLPRFSFTELPNLPDGTSSTLYAQTTLPPPPNAERKNSLTRRPEWKEVKPTNSRRNSNAQPQQDTALSSDVQSTDSEVEQNETSCGGSHSSSRDMHRRRAGSPEAWSTNSDSPTPTNSVAERWAKDNLWQGLLGDEHRQLLGTEEESSDRHSSDEEETDLETVYQITPEQREYYYKQFKAVQHDPNGLISGQVARVFFEKSRIPVEELRHIWQICDVTRDGALSLSEFTAAMHLVVLRRNNIPLPTSLPACLHPSALQHETHAAPPIMAAAPQEPPEADLLHLNDDDDEENTENTIISAVLNSNSNNVIAATSTSNEKKSMNISTLSTSSQDVPPTQWTKFTESPTSNVSSPGPKPVNFDMQRTAQAVVSDPQILHPVPLRVTPVAGATSNSSTTAGNAGIVSTTTDALGQEVNDGVANSARSYSPKLLSQTSVSSATHHRDSLQQQSSDLRAIQRPQAKKLHSKNVGAIPPPPQREPSVGSSSSSGGIIGGPGGDADLAITNNNTPIQQPQEVTGITCNKKDTQNKKDIQPPLPPRRHGRSSSLDLNKFKISAGGNGQQAENEENIEQQYSLPPQQKQISEAQKGQHMSTSTVLPLSRISLQSNQRVSAFEVYRKPNTPRNSQSPPSSNVPFFTNITQQSSSSNQPTHPPPPAPFGAVGAAAIAGTVPISNADLYEKRVNAITETLRHVSFKPDSNMTEILRHLREQNGLLLHLCNDLSDELLSVQSRKEELRLKLETIDLNGTNSGIQSGALAAPPLRTGSSISAPVTANITGGSGSSGVHSNV